MPVSLQTQHRLESALGRGPANELKTILDLLSGASQGSAVADLGTTTDLVGVDGTGNNAAPVVGTESRLDAIEAKVDALLAELRTFQAIAS